MGGMRYVCQVVGCETQLSPGLFDIVTVHSQAFCLFQEVFIAENGPV